MQSVKEIEKAISNLPKAKFLKIRKWFYNYDAKQWDKKFEEDARSGRLKDLADTALSDYKTGKCREL